MNETEQAGMDFVTHQAVALVADIGGTNARFSLVASGSREAVFPLVLPCADFPGPAEAAEEYLRRITPPRRPSRGAFAIASPVTGDRVEMTNHNWAFSVDGLRSRLGLDRLEVVNDFIAVALSVPTLGDADKVPIGDGRSDAGAPIAVLGPGTGLGVAGLIPTDQGWRPISTEGGHATLAAVTERENRVIDELRSRFGHVSAERVLSGPGLVNLYQALGALEGRPPSSPTPQEITTGAGADEPLAQEALSMFFALLGTFAGNLALTMGARGGVMIAGGILPRLRDAFLASSFRQRFEDKGRFQPYLKDIPVHLVTHPYPAFVGLSALIA